jgi:hypothetical protein
MIEIGTEEREVLAREIEQLIRPIAPDSPPHQEYTRLLAAIGSGAVPTELIGTFEQLLEITLSTGRIRQVYGPQPEQQLLRLYHRTPGGDLLRLQLRELNQSLEALRDQKIESLSFSLKVPEVYRLEINTDQCRLTLSIDGSGVSVHQREAGL